MMIVDAALDYARRGIPVFPCHGKKPLTEHGFHDASSDEVRIREWWSKGSNSNIGIPTGVASGIFVLDMDGAAGEQALRALEAKHGPLPRTRTIITSPGHLQYWFLQPLGGTRSTARVLGPGLDTRGDGGYVIAPPSIHPDTHKPYLVSHNAEPQPAPAWLIELTMRNGKGTETSAKEAPGTIREGARNSTLTSLAGTMRKRGMSHVAILAALREHNREHCDPPLPESEVQVIAESIGRYPAASVEDKLTEAGAADRFARLHGDDLRYDHRRGQWLMWEQHRWRRDNDAAITRLALEFARRWQHEAVDIEDHEKREAVLKAALRLERRDALTSMLSLAHDLKPIADAGDEWDMDPHLLGVPNGVVDLRTGALRDGRREDKISLVTGVAYDPDARSNLWEDTVRAILIDEELISFFQTAIGYSATGDTALDRWCLGFGSGRNGKGTLAHPIRHALGDYALELPASVFDLKTERAPYELARLPGRRLVMSSESGDTIRLNHDRIKQLSGGDPMSAANKYERAFEFQPKCKLWLFCNRKPRVTDDTIAFWSRVLLFPFVVSFAGREDPTLRPKLIQDQIHQTAILAWIIRGAIRYLAQGLGKSPEAVIEATREYREDQDVLGPFLEQACELDPKAETGAGDFYEHYQKWTDRQHLTLKERMTATMFGRTIGGRFKSRKDRITGVKLYLGIAIRGLF